ncbi:nitroreductase family protein [Paenibacillus ihuae]|uniref:nitroreductase family protein n=1 Tax=Paenibacillus ihuae TaxID=1232431 RepID=UPI003158EFAA
MTIIDLIQTRRTIKQFRPDAISEEAVLSWLEAASYAPNHRMTEPWEILFIGECHGCRLLCTEFLVGCP